MRTRRTIRHWCAVALGVPVVMAVTTLAPAPARAATPNLLPLTVTNNSGRADAVFLYVLGVNLTTGRLGYVDAGGTFTAWSGGAIPPIPAPDVSIAGPANGTSRTIQIPLNLSGRMYTSFGDKLKFFLTPDGLVQPAPQAPGDPNRDILFDWSEFTYNPSGLWLNSSQVDQFSVPHVVSVTSSTGVTKQAGQLVADGRNRIFDTIAGLAGGWAGLIQTRADGTRLRVLAPRLGIESGSFSPTYLDSYINQVWSTYQGTTLTVVPFQQQPDLKYFGRVSGATMNFTDASGAQVASFQKPSTKDVFGCDGALRAPNDLVVGPIARSLCAAFHRSTLGFIHQAPTYDPSQFYTRPITDSYAKTMHANMVDGRAYGFAFDDVGGFESLVNDGDPRSAGITLTPFGAASPPPPPPPGSGPITGFAGKCLDVNQGNNANGTKIQLWTCNGTAAQRWTVNAGGTLTAVGKCLDVTGGGSADGTKVELWDCNGGGAQVWQAQPDGTLRNPNSGKCLDAAGAGSADGTQVIIWTCHGGANQLWRLPA